MVNLILTHVLAADFTMINVISVLEMINLGIKISKLAVQQVKIHVVYATKHNYGIKKLSNAVVQLTKTVDATRLWKNGIKIPNSAAQILIMIVINAEY